MIACTVIINTKVNKLVNILFKTLHFLCYIIDKHTAIKTLQFSKKYTIQSSRNNFIFMFNQRRYK